MKIAIVDDELDSAKDIERNILYYDKTMCIDIFASGEEFLERNVNEYMIIFLDIEMGKTNGIKVGESIRARGSQSIIIYVTNHTAYISDALRNQPFQYLIKPIKSLSFLKEFSRAVATVTKSRKMLTVRWKGEIYSLPVGEIVFIESVARKLTLHTSSGKTYESYGKLNLLSEQLKEYDFVSSHRSYLVNMRFIREINAESLVVLEAKSEIRLQISRSCYKPLLGRYNYYLAGISVC